MKRNKYVKLCLEYNQLECDLQSELKYVGIRAANMDLNIARLNLDDAGKILNKMTKVKREISKILLTKPAAYFNS